MDFKKRSFCEIIKAVDPPIYYAVNSSVENPIPKQGNHSTGITGTTIVFNFKKEIPSKWIIIWRVAEACVRSGHIETLFAGILQRGSEVIDNCLSNKKPIVSLVHLRCQIGTSSIESLHNLSFSGLN
jgi:hypothetical protein